MDTDSIFTKRTILLPQVQSLQVFWKSFVTRITHSSSDFGLSFHNVSTLILILNDSGHHQTLIGARHQQCFLQLCQS